jgi:hypothetical protein
MTNWQDIRWKKCADDCSRESVRNGNPTQRTQAEARYIRIYRGFPSVEWDLRPLVRSKYEFGICVSSRARVIRGGPLFFAPPTHFVVIYASEIPEWIHQALVCRTHLFSHFIILLCFPFLSFF